MGLLNYLGFGKEIAEPINAIGGLYTTDKERLEGENKLQDTLQKPYMAQIEANKIYASSSRLFNSGWIPLIGWSSGFLILLFYAPQIMIITYIWGKTCILTGHITLFPMKPNEILNLVWLLFGAGGVNMIKRN